MSQGAQLNGPSSPTGKFIDTIDPDDPEYIRNLQRPAEIKEDMKQMEGRSRVSVVLNSEAFKEELEAVIHEQIRQGGPASILALQQISDLLLPQSRGSFGRSSPVIPINDIRGVETLGYTKQEKVLRCKLAACYRLVDLFGWTHGIFNHISTRISQEQEQFLVNPFGMLYSEMTASTLVKVDVRGEIVDTGSTGLGISKAGFTLHSAIHQARPDIRCIIHLHTPAAVAVSATKAGLLPISQEALICGKISYHDYRGILVDQDEKDQLSRNLGPFNKVMFLRNHGVVACGGTIEEAFHYAFNLMAACEVQVRAMPAGVDNLILVDEETREKTFKVGSQGGGGTDTSGRKWRCGELEWEALMRTLDNSGYRTGHVYKQPLMKQEKRDRANSDVEVPPASSSFTYVFDGDYEHSKYVSPMKLAMERQKQAFKAGWLTSPNTYKKQEIEEIGTSTPKKITKWVQDGETPEQRSTAVKIETANQFAPQGKNPKEFKEKQKRIRKDYYEEKVTAGPQSKILEGISWDEAAMRKEGGDQTVVVGAASKGIIQRDHQHNAVVYRSYYAANPFENMSEEEVNAYKQEVQRQEQGEEPEDVPGPEGRLISTEERMQSLQQSQEDVEQDTEDKRTQETNNDSKENGERVSESEGATQPAAPPEEPRVLSTPADPLSLAPKLEELGLDRLVDTVVQAVMASALPASLSKGQHSPRGDGRAVGSFLDSPRDSLPHVSSFPASVPEPPPTGSTPSSDGVSPDLPSGAVKTSVKANAVKVDVPLEDTSETPQMMTVQLDPVKLFQGKPNDGVMKISFTIQSKVTRRKTKGPKTSWPIENVTITQSQPKVVVSQSEEGQQPIMKKARILTEQQNNVTALPVDGSSADKVPLSPTYQQKPTKRSHHLVGRRQGAAKLAKSKRKHASCSRRGLTHPLSPVKEEFMEEDTLEALLARQNVEVDSDESLEDLLLMTDNCKENLAPAHQREATSEPEPANDKPAPIATLEDLDERDQLSPPPSGQQQQVDEEFFSTAETPVFVVPKAAVGHPLPEYPGLGGFKETTVSSPLSGKDDISAEQQLSEVSQESAIQSETKVKDNEDDIKFADDDIKFADEELSSTVLEASDGDIPPRKQEESPGRAQQLALDNSNIIPEGEQVEDELKQDFDTGLTFVAGGDEIQEDIERHSGTALESESESELDREFKTDLGKGASLAESPEPAQESPAEIGSSSKDSVLPVIRAPLACLEEDEADICSSKSVTTNQQENKALSYRRHSATLEDSPVVSSPPFDGFPPEPVHRELHRVRSLEDELDEPNSVQRRLRKGHRVVRRVQSAGPAPESPTSKNRNVAVIDAVLHTVTIDPAKIVQSGQSVSSYLSGSSDSPSQGDGKNAKWTLMDSVSKSLENLDMDDLAKEGSLIYGRSLEVLIHDTVLPEEKAETPTSPQTKSPSFENVLDDDEKVSQKGAKLYKDDVVVITKPPMTFSAISPQTKKDLVEEEGPLVTSSPKLGRRKEGSFKKYQSKMGKSEETLLEVTPVSSEKIHQAARRSKSFPKNYGLKKNSSKETLLDDHPSLTNSDRDEEIKRSTQSMPVLDEDSKRSRRRNKSRQTRRSDPSASSNMNYNYHLQAEDVYPLNKGESKSKEAFSEDALLPARSDDRVDRYENMREEKSDRRRRRRKEFLPQELETDGYRRQGEQPHGLDTEEPERAGREEFPEGNAEEVVRQNAEPERRQRRRRRERRSESAEGDREELAERDRDRRRRRRGEESDERNREESAERDRDHRRRKAEAMDDRDREQPRKEREESGERDRDRPRRRREESYERDREQTRKQEQESVERDRDRPRRRREESSDRDREQRRRRREESAEGDRDRHRRRGEELDEKGREQRRKQREESAEGDRDRPRQRREESSERDREQTRRKREGTEKRDRERPRRKRENFNEKDREQSRRKREDLDERDRGQPRNTREWLDGKDDEEPAKGMEESGGNLEQPRRGRKKDVVEARDELAYPNVGRDTEDEEDQLRFHGSGKERRRRHQRNSEEDLASHSRGAIDKAASGVPQVIEPAEEQITSIVDTPVEKDEGVQAAEPRQSESVFSLQSPAVETGSDVFPLSSEEPLLEQTNTAVIEALSPVQKQNKDRQIREDHAQERPGDTEEDDDSENRPPRVRRPRRKETTMTSNELQNSEEIVDDRLRETGPGRDDTEVVSQGSENAFMSSFMQPVRSSQTLGEDFPSLSANLVTESMKHRPEDEENPQTEKTSNDKDAEPEIVLKPEGTVPIAGNLDIQDYGDEPRRVRRSDRQRIRSSADEEDHQQSRVKQRAERRRRGRLGSDQETDSLNRGSETNISRSDSGPRLKENRHSRDSLASRDSASRASRDSLDVGDYRQNRGIRDSLGGRDYQAAGESWASRENLSVKEGRGSRATDLDLMNLDEEPPRARRDRRQPDVMKDSDFEGQRPERPRSEGRVRGRRAGHSEAAQKHGRLPDEENRLTVAPEIRVHAASRESLDRDTSVPPLPPKQHRSMERLSEMSQELRRSRSRELLDVQDVPPELPPKKNKKKTLSCVAGGDMEAAEKVKNEKKEKKTKDRSSSKDRKKMPPPPEPPVSEDSYRKEPRRRLAPESNRLQVPEDSSFRQEDSSDVSFEKDRQPRARRRNTEQYYSDSENDELEGQGIEKRKDRKKPTADEVTVSPPHTPRPARKISTSSYGSVSRVARSVSFDDGYTPTMSHAPSTAKSRESLASESSLHSTGYRMRSHSGASETSLSSNPLTHEPWRAKAAAQAKSPNSRRRARSQGEPTYSAHSGRRRRSRTPNATDANRLYQPRRTRSRGSLPDAPSRSAAPSLHSKSHDTSMLADDSFSDAYSHGFASEAMPAAPVRRSESDRKPEKNQQLIEELERKRVGRSHSDRRPRGEGDGDKPGSPTRSDPMDSASGGETLEERSSKEGSPTKEAPSPTKDKKKKKKFRMPSFSKKKKDSKESTI